jgi:hypothetical protein
MGTPLFCYKHPEYRLLNTGFFIINITPHGGMGHQESDTPILSISGAFFSNLPGGIPGNNGRRNGLS